MALGRYRPVGDAGPYPEWLRKLRGKSGVYVIRRRKMFGGWVTAYVGESHSGRLYQTLTRHFQRWKGPTSGATYSRGSVQVAVEVLPARKAPDRECELVWKLGPEDNRAKCASGDEDAPF